MEELDKRQGFRPVNPDQDEPGITEEEMRELISQKQAGEMKILGSVVKVLPGKVMVNVLGWSGEISLQDMRWTRVKSPDEILKPGDKVLVRIKEYKEVDNKVFLILALDQEPLVQGALVAIEPETGFIRAMVGGYDFAKSKSFSH